MMTLKYTNVKFDAPIDPKRFKFEAPEGVTIQDQTKKKTDTAAPAEQPQPSGEAEEGNTQEMPE